MLYREAPKGCYSFALALALAAGGTFLSAAAPSYVTRAWQVLVYLAVAGVLG